MNKLLAALVAVLTLGGVTIAADATAEAGLFYCSSKSPSYYTQRSICEGVTAGGSQHQRAWRTCLYPLYQWRTYYGPTVGVLEPSTAYAASGGTNCYGGYQLRP
jgi:hypothetical protein